LLEAGVALFALSNEPSEDQVALEKRLGGRVTFLSDPDGASLDALGLRDERGAPWYDRLLLGARPGHIAFPATVIVGRGGTVRSIHRSKAVDDRPHVDAILDNILE